MANPTVSPPTETDTAASYSYELLTPGYGGNCRVKLLWFSSSKRTCSMTVIFRTSSQDDVLATDTVYRMIHHIPNRSRSFCLKLNL